MCCTGNNDGTKHKLKLIRVLELHSTFWLLAFRSELRQTTHDRDYTRVSYLAVSPGLDATRELYHLYWGTRRGFF